MAITVSTPSAAVTVTLPDNTGVISTTNDTPPTVEVANGGGEVAISAALQGPAGRSAYEIAVTNGFAGSEADWLTSLVGNMSGGNVTGDIFTTTTARLRGFDVIQSGYVESNPVNFRFDQDQLRFVNRWGTATVTATGGISADEVDRMFSRRAATLNLNGKTDPAVIEITGISVGTTANTALWPYVLMHSNNSNVSVRMELLKANAPETWEVAYDDVPTSYHLARYTSGTGNLIGVRWTFHSFPAATNIYIRQIGVFARNGDPYQDSIFKGGDTMFGDLTLGSGYTVKTNGSPVLDTSSVSQTKTGNLTINGLLSVSGNTVWHTGNDGSGSGLDADTVDGIQAATIPYALDGIFGTTNSNAADGGIGADGIRRSMFFRDNGNQFGCLGLHVQHATSSNHAFQFVSHGYSTSGNKLKYRLLNAGVWEEPVDLLDASATSQTKTGNLTINGALLVGGSPVWTSGNDSALKNRSNHTGTQAIATVTGLQTELDAKANLSASNTWTQQQTFSSEVKLSANSYLGNSASLNFADNTDSYRLTMLKNGSQGNEYFELWANQGLELWTQDGPWNAPMLKVTQNSFEFKNPSNGALYLGVDASGNLTVAGTVTGTNVSGTNTGDEDYTSITSKLAAGSGGGTTNFLRADGTWAPTSAGGGSWGSITGALADQTDLRTALDAKAPTASPTLTGDITHNTYSHYQEVNGDVYHAINARHDGTNWVRLDTSKPAWLWEYNMGTDMVYESYKAATLWVAQAGANPINGFTAEGGWIMASSMSQFKDFTLAGAGIEIDGNFTHPYGRVQHYTVNSTKRTGLLTNAYLDHSGRDDVNKESWFAGIYADSYKVRRANAGGTLTFNDLLTIDNAGNANFAGKVTTNQAVLTSVATQPAPPSSNTLSFYARKRAGADWPEFQRPSGREIPVQAHMGLNRVSFWAPSSGSTVNTFGIPRTAVGTASTPTTAATNVGTAARRWRVTSAATANAVSEERAATPVAFRATVGFTYTNRFSLSTIPALARGLFGMTSSTGALSTTQVPSALTNVIGVGFDSSTDTTFQIYHNDGSGTCTTVDLGANFPVNTTNLYTLIIRCGADDDRLYLRFVNESAGIAYEYEAATDIPTATTGLTVRNYMNNGGTAAACSYDCSGVYLETDY